jgi:hypothetical protein
MKRQFRAHNPWIRRLPTCAPRLPDDPIAPPAHPTAARGKPGGDHRAEALKRSKSGGVDPTWHIVSRRAAPETPTPGQPHLAGPTGGSRPGPFAGARWRSRPLSAATAAGRVRGLPMKPRALMRSTTAVHRGPSAACPGVRTKDRERQRRSADKCTWSTHRVSGPVRRRAGGPCGVGADAVAPHGWGLPDSPARLRARAAPLTEPPCLGDGFSQGFERLRSTFIPAARWRPGPPSRPR